MEKEREQSGRQEETAREWKATTGLCGSGQAGAGVGREGGREGPGWTREAERNTGYGAVSTEAPVENKTR